MSTTPLPVYSFVVQDASSATYELDMMAPDVRAQKHFQSVWKRLAGGVEECHKLEKLAVPGWVGWKPWDWCQDKRPDYAPRQKFVAWCGSNLAGFLHVWPGFPSSHESGKQTLYVEHLAAAPGNQTTELWNRRYKHVGMALLAFAVLTSQGQNLDGRLSLHVSDASALSFYRKVDVMLGGGLFHPEKTGVVGPTPHAARSDTDLTYLETTFDGACRLLESYRRG